MITPPSVQFLDYIDKIAVPRASVMDPASSLSGAIGSDKDDYEYKTPLVSKSLNPFIVDSDKMWQKQIDDLQGELDYLIQVAASASQIAQVAFDLNSHKKAYVEMQIKRLQLLDNPVYAKKPSYVKKSLFSAVYGINDSPVIMMSTANNMPNVPVLAEMSGAGSKNPNFGTNMDEQKFVMRVGVQSNCNVTVQSRNGWATGTQYRLVCDQCKAASVIERTVIETYQIGDPALTEFCKTHRHDVEAPASSTALGRKFRNAD